MKHGKSNALRPVPTAGVTPANAASPGNKDKEFMLTLAKGLAVLGLFGRHRPTMTLAQAAQAVDLSRATARRVLHTLVGLGYVEQNGRQFALSPRIMRLGFAYISSQSWVDRAVPLMKTLSERFRDDHRQGFSIVDEELERGLRSIAVPVVDRDGQCVGALNLSTHSTRTTRNALRETFLPELKSVAEQVSASIT